jgi:hypothetical protein
MADKTKIVQLTALAGAGAVLLGAYYLARRAASTAEAGLVDHRQEQRLKRREEASAAATAPAATSSSAAAETCECGLTVAQGGCAPASSSSASLYNSQLLGTVKKYEKHFIICSGTEPDEWGAKIDKDEGSFAQLAKQAITARKAELTFKFKLTNSDERSKGSEGTDLIVFPGDLSVRVSCVPCVVCRVLPDSSRTERIRYLGVTAETMPVRAHPAHLLSRLSLAVGLILIRRSVLVSSSLKITW